MTELKHWERAEKTMPDHDDMPSVALKDLIRRAEHSAPHSGRGLPPVERWEPDYCGVIDMRIAGDGSWHYMGSPIARAKLVRLFSTVLRRDDDGQTYLVTPVEKVRITVDDAPFIAVELVSDGAGRDRRLTLRTNVGDVVEAGPNHPLRFAVEQGTGGLKPYILVRGRLEAKLARPLLYQLADLGEENEAGRFGIWSDGEFFEMTATDKETQLRV